MLPRLTHPLLLWIKKLWHPGSVRKMFIAPTEPSTWRPRAFDSTTTGRKPQDPSAPILSSYMESYGTFLPPSTQSSRAVAKAVHNVKFIPLRYVTGIKKRRVSKAYSSLDLAIQAADKCLKRSSYNVQDIDLVISCHIAKLDKDGKTASYEPSAAFEIKRHFGIDGARCFDINNACAGLFTGILVADKLIKSGVIRRALICSGEHISPLMETAQKEIANLKDSRLACLTLGDAGAAVLLDGTTDANIGLTFAGMKTLPEHSRLCLASPSTEDHGGVIMHTQSAQITRVGKEQSAQYVSSKVLAKAIAVSDTTKFIPHQVSVRVPEDMRKLLNARLSGEVFKKDKMIMNVSQVGNTASTAHIVAMAGAIAKGKIKADDNVIFAITASGFSVGLFQFKLANLPQRVKAIKAGKRPVILQQPATKAASTGGTSKVVIQGIEAAVERNIDTVSTTAQLANTCLQRQGIEHGAVNYLVHTGLYRSGAVEEPSHAALIAGDMGIATSGKTDGVLCFDIVNGELGWLHACAAAASLIGRDAMANIMITSAECDDSKGLAGSQPLGIAETASATLLKHSDNQSGLSDFHFESNPIFHGGRRVEYLAAGKNSRVMVTDAANQDDLFISAIADMLEKKVATGELDLASFKKFIFPQRSRAFLQRLAARLHIATAQVVDVTSAEGDLFSGGTALAFKACLDSHDLRSGDRVLIVAAASGIQVGMAQYTF